MDHSQGGPGGPLVHSPPLVVKVGGSLFTFPGLAALLAELIEQHSSVLIVPGGGGFADEVRRLWRQRLIDDAAAHWLAIRAMDLAAHFLCTLHPELQVVDDLPEAGAGKSYTSRKLTLAPSRLLLADEGRSLPIGWHVTSDSIAAVVARWMEAPLLLCKSVGGEQPIHIADAAAKGWVDGYFPTAAAGLRVEWFNVLTGGLARLDTQSGS